MRCTDCNFIKLDGNTSCLLDMHRIIDIYEDKDCKILNNYIKYQKELEESNMNNKSKLPDMTQEALKYVDATPDNMYPIRILQAHRENCNCKWSNSAGGIEIDNPLLKLMNEQNDERAKILDKAIEILQEFGNIIGCKNCEGTDVCVHKCTECSLLPHYYSCHRFMKDDQMEYLYENKINLNKILL